MRELFLEEQLLLLPLPDLPHELGYLSYDHRHADLLYEIVSRRYTHKSIVITTNKAFAEWNTVIPHASCVVTLVDRLVHHAEIVRVEGNSYRHKEAQEREARRLAQLKSSLRRAKSA